MDAKPDDVLVAGAIPSWTTRAAAGMSTAANQSVEVGSSNQAEGLAD
jgi:hypothetical protein